MSHRHSLRSDKVSTLGTYNRDSAAIHPGGVLCPGPGKLGHASLWALLRPLAAGVTAGLCMLSPVDPVRLDLRVRERCSPGVHSEQQEKAELEPKAL